MSNSKSNPEEVDVFFIIDKIKAGINSLIQNIFTIYRFLLKNIAILAILFVIGVVIGYFLDNKKPLMASTEYIISANFSSSDYLFKKTKELNSKLSEDKVFKHNMGIDTTQASPMKLNFKPIASIQELTKEQQSYLDMLIDDKFLDEDEKKELIYRSFYRFKLELIHPKNIDGQRVLKEVLAFVRKNEYFKKNFEFFHESNEEQIANKEQNLRMIDSLIVSINVMLRGTQKTNGSAISTNEINFDLAELIQKKNDLQSNIEFIKRNAINNQEFIEVVDFGETKTLKQELLSKNKVRIPIVLFLLFLLVQAIKKFHRLATKKA
ncbi:MAG: hypothetical protein RQ756_05825 [Flavobacteriaceae bacterium]|nr:hypothetical protein [Flavobacteriaceae bacterium]